MVSDLHNFLELLTTTYHIRSGKVVGAMPSFLKSGGAIAPPAPPSVPPLYCGGIQFDGGRKAIQVWDCNLITLSTVSQMEQTGDENILPECM